MHHHPADSRMDKLRKGLHFHVHRSFDEVLLGQFQSIDNAIHYAKKLLTKVEIFYVTRKARTLLEVFEPSSEARGGLL